jgi:hypothetical protein
MDVNFEIIDQYYLWMLTNSSKKGEISFQYGILVSDIFTKSGAVFVFE